jgi:hypothetical protein
MTEEELKQFLDHKLWEIGDALMRYYDPCNMRVSSCKVGDPNPCCVYTRFRKELCQYQDNGCQYPNAMCVLWLCKTAIQTTDPKCVEGLMMLEHFGNLFGIVGKPMIGQAYVGADRPKR